MAKKIHWQIPFASAIDKKQYRVDIYQEGYTGNIVTLLAGSSPFNTEEDNNPDLFTPIRTQSGTLSIVTKLPDGSMLKAQDILPSNNTDCPVQLVELNDGEEEVVWQGFLSCEAYSQDYIGIAQELSLSLISVLEAMDSVECDPTRLNGVVPIPYLIGYCFDEMERHVQFGHIFNRIYIGEQGKAIASRYINTSLFFDVQDQNDEGYNEAILKGISLKEVLTKLATFMGWCVREDRENIYIQTAGADNGWISGTVAEIMYDHQFATAESALYDLADLDWRGTGHRISSRQGARNVEVVANMIPFDIQVGIPDGFPQGEYIVGGSGFKENDAEDGDQTATAYFSKEQNFSSLYDFQIWLADEEQQERLIWLQEGDIEDLVRGSLFYPIEYVFNHYCGCTMISIKSEDEKIDRNGLFVKAEGNGAYDTLTERDQIYLLKMRSINKLNAYDGNMILNVAAFTYFSKFINSDLEYHDGFYEMKEDCSIPLVIKWGDMYWNGNSWSNTYAVVYFAMGETEIPVTSYNYGEVEVFIVPIAIKSTDHYIGGASQYVLTSLSLEYQAPEDVFEDRSANHYFEALKTAFRDDVSVECDFGSSLDNLPNPSLILDVDPSRYYEPLTRMIFFDGMQVEERPEKHLLSRLATYYRKPHASLELVAASPGVLPMMRYKGINDGKFYLPMAASRDWQQDTATLTMLQCEPYWRVYRWDDNIWDKENDYVSLSISEINTVDIYIQTDIAIEWEDHRGDLPNLYINLDYSSGTIPAGRTLLRIGYDGSAEAEGNINFFWTINGKRQHIFDIPVAIRTN